MVASSLRSFFRYFWSLLCLSLRGDSREMTGNVGRDRVWLQSMGRTANKGLCLKIRFLCIKITLQLALLSSPSTDVNNLEHVTLTWVCFISHPTCWCTQWKQWQCVTTCKQKHQETTIFKSFLPSFLSYPAALASVISHHVLVHLFTKHLTPSLCVWTSWLEACFTIPLHYIRAYNKSMFK